MMLSREITHRTKWREFSKQYRDDKRYFNLVGQSGSKPIELFEESLNEEKEILKVEKPPFKQMIKVICGFYWFRVME